MKFKTANFKWVHCIPVTTVLICFHDSREAESWPDLEAGWDKGSDAEVGSNILNSMQRGYKVKEYSSVGSTSPGWIYNKIKPSGYKMVEKNWVCDKNFSKLVIHAKLNFK